jgi:hypothetical protein
MGYHGFEHLLFVLAVIPFTLYFEWRGREGKIKAKLISLESCISRALKRGMPA